MKKGLVLAGGGTKGIYQVGCLRALHELEEDDYNDVLGVSVGSLNACMVVQNDIDGLEDMYDNLEANQIVNGFVPSDLSLQTVFSERSEFLPQLKYYVKNNGIDISPFYDMVHKYFDKDKLLNSDKNFYCVCATHKGHNGVLVDRKMMEKNGSDWLVASSSAYPAFPIKSIDGIDYVDGGYYDNLPIDYALRLGCEKIIAIDLNEDPQHPLFLDKSMIVYIHPRQELYNFLDFDKEKMKRAKILGYNDTMKTYGKYEGWKYTFYPFDLPLYFDEYYRGLLILETKIKNATSVNERLRSSQYISDQLMSKMYLSHLTTRQYLYGILDSILDIIGIDECKVYKMNDIKKLIVAYFADSIYEDFDYKLTDVSQKGLISKFIHAYFYPNHSLFSESTCLTLYPYEVALAYFVIIMMKHIGDEDEENS